jgi:hypothetical protein
MKIYKNLEEFQSASDDVKAQFNVLFENPDDYNLMLFDHPEDAPTAFMNYLGGYIYVIESLDDIKQIDVDSYCEPENRFYNLSETSGVFDMCEWTKDHKFVQVMMVTSNSGGAIYLVPRHLALQHRYLLDSIDRDVLDGYVDNLG